VNTWVLWLSVAARGESAASIASKTVYTRASVSTWIRTGRPPVDAVLQIARAYDASVLDGLEAAGWLSAQDVANVRGEVLTSAPSRDLIAELNSRALRAPEHEFYDPPTDPSTWEVG
jgi:hypothetical protein